MIAPHILALARGIKTAGAGCLCWICGDSPFDRAVVATNTATWWDDLRYPDAGGACAACAELLGGKPGQDPPPARTRTLLVVDGVLSTPRMQDLWPILETPPASPHVISWATSGKRHHWMHAGISSATLQVIGADAGPIHHRPADHAPLRAAIVALLSGPHRMSRTAIASGTYSPSAITAFGPPQWARHEQVIARHRPSMLLDLLTTCAPVIEDAAREEETMIPEEDTVATDLLAAIVRGSDRRKSAGLTFWSGELRHRVTRFARQPLPDLVSRLADACETPASAMTQATEILGRLDDAMTTRVERAFRTRGALIVAMTFAALRSAAKEAVSCES